MLPRPPESETPPITAATMRIQFEAAADPVVDDADIAEQDQPGDRREARRR